MSTVIGIYRDKRIILSEVVSEKFLSLSEGDTEIDISDYVPSMVGDVKAVSVRSHSSYVEKKRLSMFDLEHYHHVHSRAVALHREKQKTLKELAKQFSEISFIDSPDREISGMHEYYEKLTNLLWEQRKELPLFLEAETIIVEMLPEINKTMMEAIATRHICAASVKCLAEAEQYYETIFETQTDNITHYRCYRCYLPDLDISAIYDEDGMLVDLEHARQSDKESLNSLIFAGFRNTITA